MCLLVTDTVHADYFINAVIRGLFNGVISTLDCVALNNVLNE